MNDLCADIGYKSINHFGEELCGDHVDVVEENENSTVIVLADGLDGVQPEKDGVNEIIICGMGGELIARIVDASAYTRTPDVNLILQPMTCAPELRQYLWLGAVLSHLASDFIFGKFLKGF